MGLGLSVVVHPANVQHRDEAQAVLERLRGYFPRLARFWTEGGFAGQVVEWVREELGWTLEIVKRSDAHQGLAVLPHRWIVEQTLGWLGRFRPLSNDYEACISSSEATVLLAMIQVRFRRLEPA